ncbi:MAG: tRNA guanosine(34) transglycosylase Tgt [Candidatus Rokubacteria bacterium RIFCSPLOWO2_12_FULL_71_22]|nr:MAG: tRNA guanosine(34) transglycosylase Tgt [Candidatus Rokubacteria bacterium RIFCSPLOWO2_02_FULL_72_37]OGL15952.1 MAG: tRNA guanosine(34) transglycosylase Tgt [Candidatus Rokubacteria bacterium RIFCSPLOWO2_12_FULL_71_22]
MTFELLATDGAARAGRLATAHGVVDTPVFMPVGTRGAVKSLSPDDLRDAGAQIVLGNTYHLLLRPGHEVIRELGGLHRFMGWEGALLTDSGGFQVWSLAKLRKITADGVEFRSPVDGAAHFLSPELAIEIQHALGADVIHPLDECLGHPATRADAERSLALTLAWAARSQAAHRARGVGRQALFGIVQGGTDESLRRRAVAETVALGFEGYAIGGMAVGEPKPAMYETIELVAGLLPAGRPRYLMGVGKPEDLVEAIARGVDMFDCVLPTRNARNGQCFTWDGPVVIKHARFARDPAPLDGECACYACRRFSRAYLRHLFMSDELLAYRLLSLHNVHFFVGLVRAMRMAIAARAFGAFKARFFSRYAVSSVDASRDR